MAAGAAFCLVAYAQTAPDVSRLSATSTGWRFTVATNLTLRGESVDTSRKLVNMG